MKPTTRDVDHEILRGALEAIVARSAGVLNPRDVLDAARHPESVLHRHFEWDDQVAGEAYRLAQVGALVRSVKLTIVRPDPVTKQVALTITRSYQSRPSMRSAAGGYEPVGAILQDGAKRAELLAQVLRELGSYRKRYADLSELNPVWLAVDDATGEIETSPAATPGSGDARHGTAG